MIYMFSQNDKEYLEILMLVVISLHDDKTTNMGQWAYLVSTLPAVLQIRTQQKCSAVFFVISSSFKA